MTIEIHEPELEELIQTRMDTGRFRSVEDALIDALKTSAVSDQAKPLRQPRQNLGDFLMNSPLRGSNLVIERIEEYPTPIEL